jgi:hypothetical protein
MEGDVSQVGTYKDSSLVYLLTKVSVFGAVLCVRRTIEIHSRCAFEPLQDSGPIIASVELKETAKWHRNELMNAL